MRISIALATYNGSRYLAEQVDSLLAQSLLPWECVVCDDGSTDDTLAILETFARKAPFSVHIHSNPGRLGYRENFLHCASLCNGDLIAFCDQDDVWLASKLQTVAQAFASNPSATLVVHQGQVVDAQLRPTGKSYPHIPKELTISKCTGEPMVNIPGFAMTFRREVLHACPWAKRHIDPNTYDAPAAHDTWVLFIAEVLGDVIFLPLDLVQYRRHESNTTIEITKQRTSETLRSKLRSRILRMRQQYLLRATLYEECSVLLHALGMQCAPVLQADFEAASTRYKRYASIYADRAKIYDLESPFKRRANLLRKLTQSRSYMPWQYGGVSKKALSKDLRYLLLGSI